MPPHEVEVSWQSLRQIVREWAGSAAELEEVTPLVGGCVNTTLRLVLRDGARAVLKITPHRIDLSYNDEVYQLELLRELGIPVPEVYLSRTGTLESPFSFLLMEFVEGIDLAAAKATCSADKFDALQSHLAELVMTMHEHRSTHFMRVSPDDAKPYEQWHECYRDVFDGIWSEVAKSGLLPVKVKKQIGRVHDRLDRLLAVSDAPRLVHWDLWSTNILVRPDAAGRWRVAALLDPHAKYAHAEAEIAYLELFHTITPAFLRCYQQREKLPAEYHRVRRPIYQMYSLINHLQLFGADYLPRLQAAVEKTRELV